MSQLAEKKTPTCSPSCHSYIPLSSLHRLAFELALVTAVHPSIPRSYLWRLPRVLCRPMLCLTVFLTWTHFKICKTLTHHDTELEVEVYSAVGCTVSWRFRAIYSGVHGVLKCRKSGYVRLCRESNWLFDFCIIQRKLSATVSLHVCVLMSGRIMVAPPWRQSLLQTNFERF